MPVNLFRFIVLFLVCLGVWAVGFFPYQFSPHHQSIQNGALIVDQSIRINKPGLLFTEGPPRWLGQSINESFIDLKLELKSHEKQAKALTTIVALGKGRWERNFAIEQDGEGILFWLRTGDLDKGQPYFLDKVLAKGTWHSIRLLLEQETLRLWVDQVLVFDESIPPSYMSFWSRQYSMSLGGEVDGDRAWLGELRNVLVLSNGVYVSLLDGAMVRPDPLIVMEGGRASAWGLFPNAYSPTVGMDWLVNLLGFVPVGMVFFWVLRNLFFATLGAALLSVSVEVGQLFLVARTTQLDDLVLNVSGALIGIAIIGAVQRQRSIFGRIR